MASENETVADIVAEVRRNAESSQMGHKSFLAPSAEYWKSLANRIDAAWSRVRGIVAELAIAVRECNGEKYHVTLLRDADAIASGETPNCPSLVQKQGGGLDNSPGNAADLREACQKMLGLVMLRGDGKTHCILTWDEFNESQKMLRAALSAPRRQCDVGTADEQAERQSKFCLAHHCGPDCPAWRAEGQAHNGCVLVWAQMPYAEEEGGEK